MTQTAKHTPGPWHISPCYFGGVLNHIEINGETDGIAVTKCEANARLIAAAPETAAERDRLKAINAELLAALKKAVRYIEVVTVYKGAMTPAAVEAAIKDKTFPDIVEIAANSVTPLAAFDFEKSRAAIAKAEGR